MSRRHQATALAAAPDPRGAAHLAAGSRPLRGLSRLDNADTALNTWIVAWVAHQLPRDPLAGLRRADLPSRTRARSPIPSRCSCQARWRCRCAPPACRPPPPTTCWCMAGFTLSAWAMWRLVTGGPGDLAAGAVAGCAFAFNAHLLTRFAHLQALHAEFVPLVLLAVDRIARRAARARRRVARRRRRARRSDLDLPAGLRGRRVVVGLAARRRRLARPVRPDAAVTAPSASVLARRVAGAGAVAVPGGQPRVGPRAVAGRRRRSSAPPGATIWPPAAGCTTRCGARASSAVGALFPGVTVLALAGVALVDAARDRGRMRMWWPSACSGVAMSLGPALPFYGWLFDAVPPLHATRVAARWGFLR